MAKSTQNIPQYKVELRPVIDSDLPIFYEHQLDGEASLTAAFPSRNLADFMEHWAKILAEPNVTLRTILADDVVAGNIVSFEQSGEREVGYWLGRQHWGKGLATKALTEFLAIETTRPLYGYAAKHNTGSIRVLQKCGFEISRRESDVSETLDDGIEEVRLRLT